MNLLYECELVKTRGAVGGALAVALGPVTSANSTLRIEALLAEAGGLLRDYPDTKIDSQTWARLAPYAGEVLDTSLVKRLHELEIHPDFQYDSKEQGYKFAGDSIPPEGNGWEINIHKDRGLTRDDPTETVWWRRLKSDAIKDDVKISDLKPVTMEPYTLHEHLIKLAEQYNEGYFPLNLEPFGTLSLAFREKVVAIKRPSMNSKPEYITSGTFINHLDTRSEVYAVAYSDVDSVTRDDWCNINEFDKVKTDSMYHYVEIDNVGILTDLTRTIEKDSFELKFNVWARIKRLDGVFGRFNRWYEFEKLNIDRYELEKKIVNGL